MGSGSECSFVWHVPPPELDWNRNIAQVKFRSEEESTYDSSVRDLIMVLVGPSLAFCRGGETALTSTPLIASSGVCQLL